MTTSSAVRDDLGRLIVQSAADIDAMQWEPLGSPDVANKTLWRSGDIVLGLIRVAPGASKPEHTHHGAHHHILITKGSCVMVGKRVDAGSYVYIPPGVAHAVDDVGPDGVEFFYTYRPVEVVEDPDNPLHEEHGAVA